MSTHYNRLSPSILGRERECGFSTKADTHASEIAVTNQLTVTFEGPEISQQGVSVKSFTDTLSGIQAAMQHMVGHLGGHQKKPGRFPKWVRDQSDLRLISTGPGSFVVELSLQSPPDNPLDPANHGREALEALLNWDGTENSTLPGVVTERLYAISSALRPHTRVWLGTRTDRRKVEIKRRSRKTFPSPENHQALLQGWLKEVNWERHTAQLHDSGGEVVRLRFNPDLDQRMRLLATTYVEVTGTGQFDANGEWRTVLVDRVDATRSHHQPFDLEAFLRAPNPKTFDPDKVVTASESFDVDDFIRIVHQGRDVQQGNLTD